MSQRGLAGLGIAGFAAVVLLLSRAGIGTGHALFLGVLLVLLPVAAVAQAPLAEEEPLDRETVYVGSAVLLLVLAGLGYGLGVAAVGPAGLGLEAWPGVGSAAGWVGGLLAGAGVVVLGFHVLGEALNVPESPLLAELLPRTERERWLFAGLSLAAGLGEELAYRGYAISLLGSDWAAAALTSAVFGVLHAYQGPLGMLRAGMLGLVLAGGFLLSGSLWPGIVAHTAIDLLGGLVLGDRLLRRGP